MNYRNLGNVGWYSDSNNLISFQLGENIQATEAGTIDMNMFTTLYNPLVLKVGEKNVLAKGSTNMLPDEISNMIVTNRLLPELIEKQVRMLYGKGLRVYTERFSKDNKLVREWVKNPQFEEWLESFQFNGLSDNANHVAMKIIRDYYYYEDFFIRWRFYRGRVLGMQAPVAGIEHIENNRCRLGTEKQIFQYSNDYEDADFNHIIMGNWRYGTHREFKVYPRLRESNLLNHPVGVSYHKNASVGQVYGYNKFYFGIKDWLLGTNRNPQYVNSYFENSLNAKVHVIIPNEWVKAVEDKINQYCDLNQDRKSSNETLLTLNGIEIGTEYNVSLRDKYIAKEIEKLSSFLSGVKNQGKIFATYSYRTSDGISEWQITPLDLKYKEFIGAINQYDERADEIITSAKGVPSAVSNLTKEGIISVSGSDLYYNYLIYLHNLSVAEEICTEPFNMALRVNFPAAHKAGARVGFYRDVPQKQEEVAPADRVQNTVNRSIEQTNNQIKAMQQDINQLKSQKNG